MTSSTQLTRFLEIARAHISERGSPGTRTGYTADFEEWLKHCKATRLNPLDPPAGAGAAYRDHLGLASATVRRKLASLSSVYGKALAGKEPVVTWNPFHPKAVAWPPAKEFVRTHAISAEDADKIFAVIARDKSIKGIRDTAILRVLYETGMRRASITNMLRSGLLRRNGQFCARIVIKGNTEVEVEIPEKSERALKAWLSVALDSRFVFPGRAGKPLDVAVVNMLLTERVKEAGIVAPSPEETITPHSFRAAFITSLIDSGASIYEVAAAVQHSDPRTSARYDAKQRGKGMTERLAKYRSEGTK